MHIFINKILVIMDLINIPLNLNNINEECHFLNTVSIA